MKTCVNCGRENRTNRLVCMECAARAGKLPGLVPPVNGGNRAKGIPRWLREVLRIVPVRATRDPTPPPACRRTAATAGSTGEMDQLRAWFKEHRAKTEGI